MLNIEFQSTRPRGRTRQDFDDIRRHLEQFQSTRPRGRTRPAAEANPSGRSRFNPRVLAGGRDPA